ncbi:MAG: hypothetical protein SFW67_10670 [Myxococcaceae bacterium]|nr:hypothetical protein [Myxococcaceae bacterium]
MNNPTPAQTEQRLNELGELYRFAMTLLEARAPIWTDAQLTWKALTVSAAGASPLQPADATERVFRAASSSRQHFVGDEYSCWFEPGAPLTARRARAILVGVATDDGGRPDWLPPRTEGWVLLQFPDGVPPLPATVCLGDVGLLRLRKG